MIFYTIVRNIIQGLCCTFSKCSLSLTDCRVSLYSFCALNFSYTLQQIFPLCQPKVPWVNSSLYVNLKKLELFHWKPLFSRLPFTVLLNKSWRTSKYFSSILIFVILSNFARSIPKKTFLHLNIGFIFLNLLAARINFVGLYRKVSNAKVVSLLILVTC